MTTRRAATGVVRPRRRGMRLASLAMALALPFATGPVAAVEPDRAVAVVGYDVRVEPDIGPRTLRGITRVRFRATEQGQAGTAFDSGALTIDAVRLDGRHVAFRKRGSRVLVEFDRPLAPDAVHQIDFFYRGAPEDGVEFHPERSEVYTIFATSQWMVCLDSPTVRAPLRLQLVVPTNVAAVGSGAPVQATRLADGRTLHEWSEPRAVPSFAYGFAAGKYRSATRSAGAAQLHFLSADRTPTELESLFANSADMMAFFGRVGGIEYRGGYTQVLVAQTIGQEANRLTLLSEAYGKAVLESKGSDRSAEALIAHELAHQWWGILVTNESWNHFWLNEGFAVFMAAAYLEHRYGRATYDDAVARWRKRVAAVAAQGKDHSLVYEDWTNPTAEDRTVVYLRGALVLHELRETLGDAAFWRGVKHYTLKFQGKSVATPDFRQAMEEATGVDLGVFFARRVYGTAALH